LITDFRCRRCGVLLARIEGGGVSVHRGDFQLSIDGDFRASMVCYKPRCRTLNVLRVSAQCREASTPAP